MVCERGEDRMADAGGGVRWYVSGDGADEGTAGGVASGAGMGEMMGRMRVDTQDVRYQKKGQKWVRRNSGDNTPHRGVLSQKRATVPPKTHHCQGHA